MTSIIERLRKMYDRGIITKTALLTTVLEQGDPEDLDDIGSYKEELLDYLDRSPRTDEEWSKMIFFNTGTVASPDYVPPTQDELRVFSRTMIERWRKALGRQ